MRANTTARRLWINMSHAVLLLGLVLIGTVTSESPPEKAATGGISSPPKEDKTTTTQYFFAKDDNSTDTSHEEGDPDDDLHPAESEATYKFSLDDAKNGRQWSKPVESKEESDEGAGDDDDDETVELVKELTAMISNGVQLMNSATNDSDTTVTKIVEPEGDSEEEGDIEDEIPSDDNNDDEKEETADSEPEEIQIKRQDEPNFNQNQESTSNFEEPNRKGEIPAPPSDAYVTVNDDPFNSNSENDNSPLLQLTQGGYRSPFVIRPVTPRVRAQSASQQSETVENPTGNVNTDERFRQPQISPQVSYSEPFQSQFGFSSALGLRHPFIPPDSFVNTNGMVHQPVQNGFFNAPPSGFNDFTGTNFQASFAPNDGAFQALTRNPNGGSLFPTQSENVAQYPGFMVQNQQFPQPQFLASDPNQPTSGLYQTTGFLNYPGAENSNFAGRPDYSPFFRNPPPNNLQFQVNNNPFAPPRAPAGILYNPMMQFQPTFPNRPQYSPQYPSPNQQVQVQSTAPQMTKPADADKITEGETTKNEDQVKASPNKEDPSTVPFGARIQRQNGQEPQNGFLPQTEVYMRYPVKEAGYATEESLPVQNTTTKTETKKEPLPPRQIFSFFPSQLGDPYRNALNSIQPGFVADSNVQDKENNSRTNTEPKQLPPSIPFPFSQPAMALPMPGYPDTRTQNPPLMRPPAFFRSVDGTGADPFDQISMFPDQFPAPLQTGSQSPEAPALPACVHGQANASVCFEDPEYPMREVLFAMNSNPYLMERFSTSDQQLDTISLVEQDRLEHPESATNYICSSIIRYGFPLRAKDVNGQWKVIVNIDKDMGQGRFVQPVRLEVCKGAGEPCNFTQVKTACVQKYNLHRLLAWSPEKGVHNDVFRLPVACSCQLMETEA